MIKKSKLSPMYLFTNKLYIESGFILDVLIKNYANKFGVLLKISSCYKKYILICVQFPL